MFNRRTAIAEAVASCAIQVTPRAFAAGYPDKPVTVIVPQGAGGANDVIARIAMQKLSEVMGQSFVVDNRVGAGGNIGTVLAAKARPDGYTLMLTVNTSHGINPALYKNAGFDPVADFEPIGPVATTGYVLVANPAFPANSIRELITVAKAKPGTITYASAGNGTINHLLVEMLKTAADIDLLHVPYRTAAASVTDVVSGQVPLSMQSLPSSLGFIKSGKLKVLGVANQKRLPLLPDMPTIGETLPGFGVTPWYGLLAPAGTPRDIVAQIHAALDKVLDSKDTQDKLSAQGCEPYRLSSAEFASVIKAEVPYWARVVKASGAKID